MSRPGVGTRPQEKRLHRAILTAVRNGYTVAVDKAAERMKEIEEKYNLPTPENFLDFCDEKQDKRSQCYSPLMYACEKNSLEMVRLLLRHNASVGFVNQRGLNALHVACRNGHIDVVEALLQAAEGQHKFCLKKRLPSNIHIALNARTKRDGWCPLLYAVKGGHVTVVKCLLEKEKEFAEKHTGSVRSTNKKKQNVLHIAAHYGRLDCLKELHPHVPNTIPETDSLYLATDKKGWNVLHFACAGGNVEVLKWLLTVPVLKTSEVLNGKTKCGYTPLLTACEYQQLNVVEYLAKIAEVKFSACCADQDSGIDEEGRQGGMTGLHLAAIHDSLEIASLLIEKGCPIDALDKEGETALHIAIRKTSLDVADMLRRAPGGKELERIRNKRKQTPSDIQPEEVIPPEIKKRGKHAEEIYRRALRKGKKRIPRCNLLVLGEQRVGKTSLIRLLLGKKFIELEPTRGIENHVVDTVDMRSISTTQWEEVKREDQAKENDELLVNSVVEEVGQLQPLQQEKKGEVQSIPEEGLLTTLDEIFSEMERMLVPRLEGQVHIGSMRVLSSPHVLVPPVFPTKPQLVSTAVPRRAPEQPSQPPRPHPTTAVLQKQDRPEAKPRAPVADKATKPHLETQPASKQKTTVLAADSSEQRETPKQVGNRRTSGVSRRQIQSINRELKSTSRQKKEPTLRLNTYDFAGQKEYRPMHHCFISRRSIYLVVFNLQKLVKLIQSGKAEESSEALEEIRYWLNSIHAHIHSGPEDGKMKRVFLVGTHMSPKNPEQGMHITEDELQQIHELLENAFYNRSGDPQCRFANHLQFPGLENRIFAAIENSFDGSDERTVSGAEALQQKLTQTSTRLEFLKEEFPILWLRFEELLIRLRETQQQRKASQVVKLADVRNLALQCGIEDQEEIEQALLFFHDTGTIICLKELPTLFLEEWEQEQLADLVLLDPKWLITLMRIVMELEDGAIDYTGEDLRYLKETGIARAVLLCDCWKEYHSTDDDVSFRQLCLMLQAYCLIYPVKGDVGRCIPRRSQSDNHKISTTTAAASHNLSHSQSVCGADTTADNFLVPCKLPKFRKNKEDCSFDLPWISFYFDFRGFLPVEIFNRFMCLMLARPQAKYTEHQFSATCCQFDQVEGCNWKLEIEAGHLLKVSVIPKRKEKPPSLYILMVHNEFLQKICEKSDLKGLVYHGGPKVVCKCKWSGILHCVDYPDDHDIDCNLTCPKCFEPHNTDELLSLQVQKNSKIKGSDDKQGGHQSLAGETEEAAKVIHHTINVHASQAIIPTAGSTVVTPSPVTPVQPPICGFPSRPVMDIPPCSALSPSSVATHSQRQPSLQSSSAVSSSPLDTNALVNVLRELKEVTDEWYELGLILGLECSTLETIKATNQTVKERKRTMVVSWLQKKDNSSPSWQALVTALRDPLVNCPDIANQIEQNHT